MARRPVRDRQTHGVIVARVRATAAGDLAAGVLGGGVGLCHGTLPRVPAVVPPGRASRYAPLGRGAVALSLLGATAGTIKRADLQAAAVRDIRGGRKDRGAASGSSSTRRSSSTAASRTSCGPATSGDAPGAALHSRRAQFFADSGDGTRRERDAVGLEMLAKMQKESTVHVEIDDEDPDGDGRRRQARGARAGAPDPDHDQ